MEIFYVKRIEMAAVHTIRLCWHM